MLKQRIITAAWLLPLAFLCLLSPTQAPYYPVWLGVQGLVLALFVWGGVEWTQLMRLKPLIARLFVGGLALILVACALLFTQMPLTLVWTVTLLWWGVGLGIVLRYQKKPFVPCRGNGAVIVTGACLLVLPYLSFLYLKTVDTQHNWLLYAMLVVWCADTGAYFVGKKFGQKKLANRISPGKTREGFLGAVFSVWLMAILLYFLGDIRSVGFTAWFFWVTAVALASVLGDLLESLFKRVQGVKDSGTALPGHGGILDRIDSLTAALPVGATLHYFLLVK